MQLECTCIGLALDVIRFEPDRKPIRDVKPHLHGAISRSIDRRTTGRVTSARAVWIRVGDKDSHTVDPHRLHCSVIGRIEYRARQLYKNISMLFLFPVKDGKLSTGVNATFMASCYG